MLRGDFGTSWFTGNSVAAEMKKRVPVTVELGAASLVLSLLFGIPIGLIAAVRQDTWLDYVTRGGAILLLSIPTFWVGLLVVALGFFYFDWAPPARYTTPWDDPSNNLQIMLWPVLLLGFGLSGTKMRLVRTQLLEVLRQDYVRTARAKGLPERRVLLGHAMRNSLNPRGNGDRVADPNHH